MPLAEPRSPTKHPFALRQAKRAVNQTLDVQGFYAAIQSVFDIHQTGHGHALSESGLPILMLLDGMKAELEKPAPTRSVRTPTRPLVDFPVFDADNHLYETEDAFTRHLPAHAQTCFVSWRSMAARSWSCATT